MSAPLGAIRSVAIVGGGTAGFLTALALRKRLPHLHVDVIASSAIPVIGVGESSIFHLVHFLHEELGLDRAQLHREVQPTWKLGLRFTWGIEARPAFNWPFDRLDHGAAHAGGIDVVSGSLMSVLMEERKSFVVRHPAADGGMQYLKARSYGYHLDNVRFVAYLQRRVAEAGVRLIDAQIHGASLDSASGDVTSLHARDGRTFTYDLYVDCSGFRSLLLGDALGVPWVSYRSSLLTDRAIAGSIPNGGRVKPYTEARTMPNGWIWMVPTRTSDHVGYVYSSAHADARHAEETLHRHLGVEAFSREIRFDAGRRECMWHANVLAVGNAAGFVEPLQSSAIQLILAHGREACHVLGRGAGWREGIAEVNARLAAKWDFVRWLIALHYRLNQQGGDTAFWRECRATADISGFEPMVEYFRTRGLLTETGEESARVFAHWWEADFMGPHGIDLLLLAMGVEPAPGSLTSDPARHARFRRQRRIWKALAASALYSEDAFALVDSDADMTARPARAH